MELKTYKFERAIPLLNIDGTPNTAGKISHYTYLDLYIPYAGGHKSRSIFAVTDIDDQDVILGIDWLQKHNPTIDWKHGSITLHCCGFMLNPIRIKRGNPPEQTRQYKIYEEVQKMNHKDTAHHILAGFSKSQELAIRAMDGKTKTFEEMVLKPYHDYRDVFSKEKSNRLPAHKSWDLEIKLKEGAIISPFFPLFILIPTVSAPPAHSDIPPPLPLPLPLPFRSPHPFPRSL